MLINVKWHFDWINAVCCLLLFGYDTFFKRKWTSEAMLGRDIFVSWGIMGYVRERGAVSGQGRDAEYVPGVLRKVGGSWNGFPSILSAGIVPLCGKQKNIAPRPHYPAEKGSGGLSCSTDIQCPSSSSFRQRGRAAHGPPQCYTFISRPTNSSAVSHTIKATQRSCCHVRMPGKRAPHHTANPTSSTSLPPHHTTRSLTSPPPPPHSVFVSLKLALADLGCACMCVRVSELRGTAVEFSHFGNMLKTECGNFWNI